MGLIKRFFVVLLVCLLCFSFEQKHVLAATFPGSAVTVYGLKQVLGENVPVPVGGFSCTSAGTGSYILGVSVSPYELMAKPTLVTGSFWYQGGKPTPNNSFRKKVTTRIVEESKSIPGAAPNSLTTALFIGSVIGSDGKRTIVRQVGGIQQNVPAQVICPYQEEIYDWDASLNDIFDALGGFAILAARRSVQNPGGIPAGAAARAFTVIFQGGKWFFNFN